MSNLRAALASRLRRDVPDDLWDVLVELGLVADAETEAARGDDPAQYLPELTRIARRITGTGQSMLRPTAEQAVVDGPRGAAASARIDALTAVYAAWAQHDPEVEAFRQSNL